MPGFDDYCEHGNDGFCMSCCRESEGKPVPKDDKPAKRIDDDDSGYGDWTG